MNGLIPSEPGLAEELACVERLVGRLVRDSSPLVTRMALHTFEAGGKRLRPLLCLLAGRFGDPRRRGRVVRVAAGMELIHLATLVHDDVVDRSPTRRARPTPAALWGSGMAVLAGDYLFAASFNLLDGDQARLLRLAASMVRQLCAGAIEEVEQAGRLDQREGDYYRRIYRKTAVFLETTCRTGAIAAGAPPGVAAALARYGRLTGLAFQIADDLLDFTGDPAVTGKPAGSDLRAGLLTLPMLYGRRDPAAGRLLERCFGRRRLTGKTVARVTEELRACGALERAAADARRLAGQAVQALAPLAGKGPVESLGALALLAAARTR